MPWRVGRRDNGGRGVRGLRTVGQAFHWFDRERAKREFARILRPGGWIVLLWNDRDETSTPFAREYEQLLVTYGKEYLQVKHRNISESDIADFFRPSRMTRPKSARSKISISEGCWAGCDRRRMCRHPANAITKRSCELRAIVRAIPGRRTSANGVRDCDVLRAGEVSTNSEHFAIQSGCSELAMDAANPTANPIGSPMKSHHS